MRLLPAAIARTACFVSVCLLTAGTAAAQPPEPPGPFVIDLHGAYSSAGTSEALAAPRGLLSSDLPGTVLGIDAGAHVYPVRRKVTIGLGASLLLVGGSQAGTVDESGVASTAAEFRARGVMPQLSLNFGSSRGWSYLGAGFGLAQLKVGKTDSDLPWGPMTPTIHFGGGARWFIRERLAFSFDGRFYRVGAKPLDGDYLGNPTVSMFVLSAGVSVK